MWGQRVSKPQQIRAIGTVTMHKDNHAAGSPFGNTLAGGGKFTCHLIPSFAVETL